MRAGFENRLRRAEEYLQELKAQEVAAEVVGALTSIEERVCVLRRALAHVHVPGQWDQIPDPFPKLQGDEYLLAHCPWYLANGLGQWPAWATHVTERICCSVSPERRVRCIRDSCGHFGVPDRFPELEGERYMSLEQERGADLDPKKRIPVGDDKAWNPS